MNLLPRLFNRGAARNPVAGGFWNRAVEALSVVMHIKAANRWRDQFNPLRGLTIARAINLLEAGDRGEYADLQWLYRLLEKRDPILKGLLERYDGGLLKLDWKISTVAEEELPDGYKKEDAEEQAQALQEAYSKIDNLTDALEFLILAEFRGYSHLEKHRLTDGCVCHLEPVDQWYWVRDGINGAWQYNREARSGTSRGEVLPDGVLEENFIVREVKRPVNEIALINYVFKNLCKKDWAGFVESFGIPWLFLVGPPNVPRDKEAEYQAAAERIIANSRGYLPNGSDVKSGSEGSRGVNPHKQFKDDLSEEVVLAGTGGKLTMLAESGSGTLAGGAHQEAWDEIIAGKGKKLSEVFQRQFDKVEVLDKQFPGEPVLAWFELSVIGQDEEDKKFYREVWKGFQADGTVNDIMANLTSIRSLTKKVGLPLNEEYDEPYLPVRDDKGIPVTGETMEDSEGDIIGARPGELNEDGEQEELVLDDDGQEDEPEEKETGEISLRNRSGQDTKFQKAARAAVQKALASDLQPLLKRLEHIRNIEDPEILSNRLKAFLQEIETLEADITADPELAKTLAAIQGASLVNGFTQANGRRGLIKNSGGGGRWITTDGGARVFIEEGQSVEQAVQARFGGSSTKPKKANKKISIGKAARMLHEKGWSLEALPWEGGRHVNYRLKHKDGTEKVMKDVDVVKFLNS